MTIKTILSVFIAFIIGYATSPSYASDTISCSSFEGCVEGSSDVTNILLQMQAEIEQLQAFETSLTENVPFIGTYFVRNDANDPHSTTLSDLHSDGTITNTTADMFCIVAPCAGPQAPGHGKWKKTGENEVSVVLFIMVTNDVTGGGDFTKGGTIFKITWIQTFDNLQDGVFQHFSVENFHAKGYGPADDLFGDPEFEVEITDAPFSGQRINLEQ